MAATPLPRRFLPWRFRWWWAAAAVSNAGDTMLAFALIWLASGHGVAAVALTSTLALVPRVAFMLLGGVLGDRHGPRRILLLTYAAQAAVLLVLLGRAGPSPGVGLLAVTALVTGTLGAFQQPAATVFPRLLLRDQDQLPRALAQVSAGIQLARILGVPLGGALVAAQPLPVMLALNAATAFLALGVLLGLRPRATTPTTTRSDRGSIRHDLVDGLRAVNRLRVWPLLVSVALVCAAVLPTVAVLVPITARARGWTAVEAARIETGWAAGVLAVTLVVSLTSTLARTRVALVAGPGASAAGLAWLALSPSPGAAALAAVVVGGGTGLFTSHVAPTLIRLAPADRLTRFQSLLGLVQLLPPALLSAPYAALGARQPALALGLALVFTIAAAVLALRPLSPPPAVPVN